MANEKKDLEKTSQSKPKPKKENFMTRTGKLSARWFREMRSELKKVVWPTRKQTINNSCIAGVIMVTSGIVIWGFDQIAMLVVQTLISIGA